MTTAPPPLLPIEAILSDVRAALRATPAAVVVAPPGAGKTTRLPLALLDEPWATGRIILLEPRRLAARAAATRMAALSGEALGNAVGLKIRFEGRSSARTRIEVVTEGVFTRMILDDPELAGVSAVIFDEFHERSLEADLGLALALDARALRPDLRILVMSATLDGSRVAKILADDAPVLVSEGRSFPVETRYVGRDPGERIEEAVARTVRRVLAEDAGSLLVFLPGQGEITRVAERLAASPLPPDVHVVPLYAAMDRRAQDEAVTPSPAGRRKVVLATSIAETSLTIDGVRVVVDSGLARVPRYEPGLGLTRLETVRVSRASADQRRGRAGRTAPGICYRLWEEAATGALPPFGRPAILSSDLSGLLLDCAAWGARRPAEDLIWLDPPPTPALDEARAGLRAIGALDTAGGLTEHGRRVRGLALPPRLAHMVVTAGPRALLAAEAAVVIAERGLGGPGVDLRDRVARFRRDPSGRAEDARILARTLVRAAGGDAGGRPDVDGLGRCLAAAFPDRIAKARGKPGEFLMANGRAASVEPHDGLAASPFLAIGEVAGRAGAARILLAAPLDAADLETVTTEITTDVRVTFDPVRAAVVGRRQQRLGAIVLVEAPIATRDLPDAAPILAAGLAALGIDRLPFTPAQRQWRERVAFLHAAEGAPWPDVSDAALAADGAAWLVPFLDGVSSLAELSADRLDAALKSLLPFEHARDLDRRAPALFETPAGASHRLDYAAEQGPTLSVRVQELYGLSVHPHLAGGRIPVVLELLSPAGRPIQITRDLPAFWRGTWREVRSEMKGRYPKHLWPEDPAAAVPTLRAKPRGT